MAEFCARDNSLPTQLSVEELRAYFPNLETVDRPGQYNTARYSRGVFVLDMGKDRMIRIKGVCPNWQNGECKLGENCFSKVIALQIPS